MKIVDLFIENIPKIAYVLIFVAVLAVSYLYSIKRSGKKESIILVVMILVFPFIHAYNGTYYDLKFKGIFFVLLITLFYYLFFKIQKNPKIDWAFIIFILLSALIIRMRFMFITIILIILGYFINYAVKNRDLKLPLIYFLGSTLITFALFFIQKISFTDYLIFSKFGLPKINELISNFFLFPRQNTILFLLCILLIFFNILLILIGKSGKAIKKEVLFIVLPEIFIFLLYTLFFSNNDFGAEGLYLGLFPFLALNIIYFYLFLLRINIKSRYALLSAFLLFSLVGSFIGKMFYYV